MITRTLIEIIELIDGNLFMNGALGDEVLCGVCTDSRKVVPNNIYVALKGENNDGHDYIEQAEKQGAGLIILSNADKAPLETPFILVDDTLIALKELAEGYRKQLSAKFIAITGSNGKTSTKDMLASVLAQKFKVGKTQGNYNNEIGVPLTLLAFDEDIDFGIVEIGMENIGDIMYFKDTVAPDIGIVTNVGCAHLKTFKTMENIGKGKLEMFDIIKENGWFLYNDDDPILSKLMPSKSNTHNVTITKFGEDNHNELVFDNHKIEDEHLTFTLNGNEFKLNALGKHQILNALPVIAIALKYGLSVEEINNGFANVETSGMRDELCKIRNFTILNDAYKSNPQSALAALDSFKAIDADYKIVIFADMLDLGDDTKRIHYDLGRDSLAYDFDEMLLYGPLSEETYRAIKELSDRKVQYFMSKEEIVDYLNSLENDVAILVKGSRGMKMDEIITSLKGDK